MPQTLHVTIGRPDRTDLEETLGDIDAGDTVDPAKPRLAIESVATFGEIFRPTNLELLEAIAEYEPDSIRELARIVDRHPPDVHSNVHELENCGLIELEAAGRSKRPVIWYDEIDVDIPLPTGESDPEAVSS